MVLFYFLIGYIFGNIQTAYIVTMLLKKEDIRQKGHGNSGASNVVLNYGFKFGVFVALVDIAKAYLAIKLSIYLMNTYLPYSKYVLFLTGLGVFLGHCHPIYMNFKGGKGTACIIGILFSMGIIEGILGVGTILTVSLISDYIAIGTFFLNISMISSAIYFKYDSISILIAIFITCISFIYHIENYVRIFKKGEERISQSIFKH